VTSPATTNDDRVRALLRGSGVGFSEDAAGRLAIAGGPDDYLIELDPARGLMCLFGVDMQELRLMVSGAGNEDLGEDELQRVAREHLRPMWRRHQPRFAASGFTEEVVVDAESYAVAFVKPVVGMMPEAVVAWVQWCRGVAEAPHA
jgi:hypothetical protein